MRALLVLLIAALGGSLSLPRSGVSGDAVASATIGTPFSLAVGQSSTIEGSGLVVRFGAVPSDSRCPVEVACVWGGVATVTLTLLRKDQELAELTLDTLGTTDEAEGLRFSLVKLDPPASIKVQAPEYVGLFLIEPAAP